MTPVRRLAVLCLAVTAVVVAPPAAAAQSTASPIAYSFRYERPGDDTVIVEITLPQALSAPAALVMPRAIPMGYGEQRYDAFVADVMTIDATDARRPAAREEGPRWRVPAGTRRIDYRVDLRRLERDVRAASDQSRVRDGYVAVLGYSVFAFVDGLETRPVTLRVDGPDGWPVFSTLAPAVPVATGAVTAAAEDYYTLADGQIVMGPRAVVRRLTDTPAPLYLAAYSEGPVDLDRVGRLAVTAYQRVAAYFGSVPFAHYTMHQELLTPLTPQHEYGMSMEHLSSSTYYLAASAGLTPSSTAADDARVLYNFAHHISHAWVPKRSYGHGYFPFQWELAPVLDSIWFAEGFGQYAAIMAVAAGEPDPVAFRRGMLERRFHANLASAPPFLTRLPLVDLSRVASTRYAEDFRTGRLVFSRGGLMAAAIDERIQAETKGARTLRDAFRYLVAWTAKERRAFASDELAPLIRAATGVDTSAVVAEWLQPLQ
jgi:predicted metalloprotease with PDZ domain